MNKIVWTAQKTNVEVLEMFGEKRKIMETIVRREKNWIDQILKGESILTLREVMEGRMERREDRV